MVARTTTDVPLLFARDTVCNWQVDWRGQAGLEDTNGGEQIVQNAFPRFVGAPEYVFPPEMIPDWRALRARGRGRIGAFRLRMTDVVAGQGISSGDWREAWLAWRAGIYVEPRPRVPVVGAVLAGATSIVVNETTAPVPIKAGTYLSYSDWPFIVRARSGSGAAVTLTVEMLRVAIPDGGMVDLTARGLFVPTTDTAGWPNYDISRVARVSFPVIEWITR